MYAQTVLTALIAWPAIAAVGVLTAPARWAKHIALAGSLLELAISVPLWWVFQPAVGMQLQLDVPWIPNWGIHYAVGVDGISLFLILLTTFLMPLSILGSYTYITTRERAFYALLLVLTSGMIGVFVALDLFLFYIMWDVMLIPMYFIIGVWGGQNRLYAAIKFFVYTFLGALLMLVASTALVDLLAERPVGDCFCYLLLPPDGHRRGAVNCGVLAVRRLLPRVRNQGPDLPVPHLAPRRPRGGADRGLGDPRRGAAQDGDVRLFAIRAAAVPPGGAPPGGADGDRHVVVGRDHLRRARRHGAARLQEADRLFVGGAPGIRDARDLGPDTAERPGSAHGHDQSRHFDGRAVLSRRHAVRAATHPANRGVRRDRQGRAALRRRADHRVALVDRPSGHDRLRGRGPRCARRVPRVSRGRRPRPGGRGRAGI